MQIYNSIYNTFIKIIVAFLPKNKRRKFREKYLILKKGETTAPYFKHKYYGKVYYPIYPKSAKQNNDEQEIYNKDGQKMRTFFVRDYVLTSWTKPFISKYYICDKFNFGLNVHFYTHGAMLEQIGKPDKKYGMFIEPESIMPASYRIFDNNKGLEKDFDLIFTHTERFLEKFENARLAPLCANIWHIMQDENGNLPANWLELKNKNASIVSADKKLCDLHLFRIELAKKCKREHLADTFGTFDGGPLVSIDKTLTNYRYSFAIENQIESFWFTEKILNCFANMTIPIYLGATKIDEFFNPNGIIKISTKDLDNIDKILKNCDEKFYLERIEAIKDNYYRALKFKCSGDFLYENYLEKDLK